MIWGVGCYRSGTRSLAKTLGAEHEPEPRIGGWTGMEEAWIGGRLKRHPEGVVDAAQSNHIPLIRRLDPDAVFYWVLREPMGNIHSLLAGSLWTDRDEREGDRLCPYGRSRVERACRYWRRTNEAIDFYRDPGAAFHKVFVTDLDVHENRHTGEVKNLSVEDAREIMERCGPLWEELRR